MAALVELIECNMDFFDKLVKAGKVPLTVKQEIDIYKCYLDKTSKGKMQRYSDVAEEMGLSVITVRRAVKEMNRVI